MRSCLSEDCSVVKPFQISGEGYSIFFKHYNMLKLLNLLGVADLWSKLTVYVVYVRLPITQLGIYLLGKVTEIHRVHVTEKYKTREL